MALLTFGNLPLSLYHTALRLGVEGQVVQGSQRVQHQFFVERNGKRVCEKGNEVKQL